MMNTIAERNENHLKQTNPKVKPCFPRNPVIFSDDDLDVQSPTQHSI